MTDHPKWRRRNFLVHPKVQVRFIALLLLQMSIILAALGILVNSHVTRVADIALAAPGIDPGAWLRMQGEILDNMHGFYMRSLFLIAATTVLMVAFGVLASHKLAGPVIKLRRFLSTLTEGDFSQRIAFRRKDHLDGFAESLNRMTAAFQARRDRMRTIARDLAGRCERLQDAGDRERLLDEMQHLAGALKEAV